MQHQHITIETTVNAPAHKVWDSYTRPEHIVNWNFASPDWHCPKATNDLKAGGTYYTRMEAKDGSYGFDFEAVYHEIVPLQKISYTLTDGRMVTTTFAENGKSTVVSTTFEAEQTNPLDMQRDGWQAILNNFKSYVESETVR